MGGFQQERVPGGKEVQKVVLDRFAVGVPADLGTARRLSGGDHVLLAPGSHGQQDVDPQLSHQLPYRLVARRLRGAKLRHIAQHGDPLASLMLGKDRHIRPDGAGVGVIAVVDHHPVAGKMLHPQAVVRRGVGGHPLDDLLLRQAKALRHGHRQGGQQRHVDAGGGDGQRIGLLIRYHRAAHALQAKVLQLRDADGAGL